MLVRRLHAGLNRLNHTPGDALETLLIDITGARGEACVSGGGAGNRFQKKLLPVCDPLCAMLRC